MNRWIMRRQCAFPCPTSVRVEVRILSCVPLRDAAYLGHRIPGATGPRLLPCSPPGSKAHPSSMLDTQSAFDAGVTSTASTTLSHRFNVVLCT